MAAGRMAGGRPTSSTPKSGADSGAKRRAGDHHSRSRFPAHPEQMPAEMRRDYPRAGGLACRACATHMIVSSRYAAGEVTRELQVEPARMHVCHPGHRRGRGDVGGGAASCRAAGHILFMGTLSLRKNIGTLARSVCAAARAAPDAPPLVLAGHRTPTSARWEARSGSRRCRDTSGFTGYVSTAQRDRVLCARANADVAVLRGRFGLPVSRPWRAVCQWWCLERLAAGSRGPGRHARRSG